MATTVIDWLNDGTLPQNKTSGSWTPSQFNEGKFRQAWTPTAASTHASWRGASLTYFAILTTNDTNGGGLWLEWDPSTGVHTLMVTSYADGLPISGATLPITWGASQAMVYTIDQSSASAGASTLTMAGALTGNGTSSGYTRETILGGANLYLGVWGSGGFNMAASVMGDIDDANDGIGGTAAVTLGTLTSSGAGAIAISATGGGTLGALTSSGVGTLPITSTGGGTLDALTVAGVGALESTAGSGTLAATLGDLASSGTGTLPIVATGGGTLGDATAAGAAVTSRSGSAAVTLGDLATSAAGLLAISGTGGGTLGAVTAAGVGTASTFGLGDYGAARVLYGTAAGTCTVTLDTQATTTIVVVTGGNLGDLVDPPTDSNANTYTAIGSAVEYTTWTGYGLRAWICIGATGGASHAISQEFGQTLGFDEATICVWEVPDGALVQSSSLLERAADAGTAVCGAVSTTAPSVILQAWSGDATTGTTSSISIDDGTVLDVTTLVDHPNGYVPIGMAYAAKSSLVTSYAPTWTQSPSQGAILFSIAVQAVEGRIGTGGGTLGTLTASGTGELASAGTLAATLGDLTSSGTGTLPIVATGATTLGAVTAAGVGALALSGTASVTLGDLTGAGVGTLPIVATGAATLGDVTSSAAGTLPIAGTGAATLDALTSAGTGTLPIVATGGGTLADLTVVAGGSLDGGLIATLGVTLDALTAAGVGVLPISGSAASTLDALTAAGSGSLPITATGAATLGALTSSAAGTGMAPEVPRPLPTARVTLRSVGARALTLREI